MTQLCALKLLQITTLILSLWCEATVATDTKSVKSANEPPCHNTCTVPACTVRKTKIESIRNSATDPCTDFYKHVCGNWKGEDPKTLLRSNMRATLKELLESSSDEVTDRNGDNPTAAAIEQAKKAYKRCLDDTGKYRKHQPVIIAS